MILGRLLSALFDHGVVFVMTTNYAPDGLWPDGLQRERFLPTIALIKEWLDVIEVDAGVDYRLRTLQQVESYPRPRRCQRRSCARRGVRGDARPGADDDPKLVIDGRSARRPKARRKPRLVRLRHAVRWPSIPARLSRAGLPFLGAVSSPASQDERRNGRTGRAASPGSSTYCTITA
jgi:predicted ATPase